MFLIFFNLPSELTLTPLTTKSIAGVRGGYRDVSTRNGTARCASKTVPRTEPVKFCANTAGVRLRTSTNQVTIIPSPILL